MSGLSCGEKKLCLCGVRADGYHGLSEKEKCLRGPAPTSQLERDRAQGVMDQQ